MICKFIISLAYILSCFNFLVCFSNGISTESTISQSEVVSFSGHWPASYCRITNVHLSLREKMVKLNADSLTIQKHCFKTQDIWQFGLLSKDDLDKECDQTFSKGHFFTMYYFHGSNYFHLHYDTAIPIYVTLYLNNKKKTKQRNEVLLPGVEITRGQGIDWETNAFFNTSSYWMETLRVLAGQKQMLPLDPRLNAMNKTVCFKEAYFGTPRINFSDPRTINSFSTFVKESLDIKPINWKPSARKRVGLIHRERRRKILNEIELLRSIESFAEGTLLDFTDLPFADQIRKVQKLDVLVGINGAGLMNAIYLPSRSVAVQLIPYRAQLNVEEFGELLKARGPYLEWHNQHPDMNYPVSNDTVGSSTDTYVHVEEFADLMRKAITLLQENEVLQV